MTFKKIGLAAVTGLAVLSLAACSSSNSSKESEQSSKAAESRSIASSKSASSKSAAEAKKEAAKWKKINKTIASSLKEDQGFAANDSRYAYAQYFTKITYESGNEAKVQVTPQFVALSQAERTKYANKISGLIGAAVVTAGYEFSAQDQADGVYLSLRYGQVAIGRSTYSDTKQYKWYK